MHEEAGGPSSRRRGRPPRGSEHDATDRILSGATPIFLELGFEATSIDSVAAVAGVSKKTFYNRFASKTELFDAVCLRFVDRNLPTVEEEVYKDGPLEERLHRIGAALLKVALKPETVAFRRMMIAEATRHPHFARLMHDAGSRRILRLIEHCLAEGMERQAVQIEDVTDAAAYFFTLTVRAPLERALLGLEPADVTPAKREELRRAIDFFLKGCRP